MPESTLSLSYYDIAGEVGLFLGYGRGANNNDQAWTTHQQAAIDSCVRSGLRQFYFPPPVDGVSAYDWSFLKPTYSTTLLSTASVIALPDDFGGFEGRITLNSSTGQIWWPIDVVGEGTVRQRYSELPTATGRPLLAAIQPIKGTTQLKGQRFQLYFFPLADQDYPVQFAYYVSPDYLTGSAPYAYGGMPHAETILESCLAVAEQRLDDSSTIHSMKFMERLAASISLDRRSKPQKLGYNGDRSDQRYDGNERHWLGTGITVNGVIY